MNFAILTCWPSCNWVPLWGGGLRGGGQKWKILSPLFNPEIMNVLNFRFSAKIFVQTPHLGGFGLGSGGSLGQSSGS